MDVNYDSEPCPICGYNDHLHKMEWGSWIEAIPGRWYELVSMSGHIGQTGFRITCYRCGFQWFYPITLTNTEGGITK